MEVAKSLMKILLYNPPMPYEGRSHKQTPLGLCYLSNAIKDIAECFVYDGNVLKDFYRFASEYKPDVMGISILTATYNTVVRSINELKRILPHSYFIAGGIHASIFPEEILKNGFDLVIRGEGEITFKEIIMKYEYFINKRSELEDVDGISFWNGSSIVHTPDRKHITDLDTIAYPDRRNLPLQEYEHDSIITSRGCAFNCFYCSSSCYWGQRVRYRSAENVFNEIKEILDSGIDKIYFCDDNFTSNHKLVKDLCQMIISNHLEFRWSALTRVDTVNLEILLLMRQAGCEVLSLGIENGTPSFMNETKKTSLKKTIDAFTMIKEAKIKTRTTWIVGLGKSYMDEKASFELLKVILPDQVSVHALIPFPNTDAWNNPDKYNLIIDKKNINWDIMNMTYSPDLLNYIRYKHISKGEIEELLLSVREEMKKYGYDGRERIFETFVDKDIVPVL